MGRPSSTGRSARSGTQGGSVCTHATFIFLLMRSSPEAIFPFSVGRIRRKIHRSHVSVRHRQRRKFPSRIGNETKPLQVRSFENLARRGQDQIIRAKFHTHRDAVPYLECR